MKKFYWMIGIGLILTLLPLVTICTNHCPNQTVSIVINILATIGSGILCSAIVSFIIEKSNNNRTLKLKKEQQKYILLSIKTSLLNLLSLEYRDLSEYLTLSNTKNRYKIIRNEIEIEKVLNHINNCLNQITKDLPTLYLTSNVIDKNYIKRIKRRNQLAFENKLPYYERLNKELLKIYEDSNLYYISEIFSEEQLKNIHDIQIDVDSIILFSNENGLESLFEYKQIFIKDIINTLNLFDIMKSDKISCSYISIV